MDGGLEWLLGTLLASYTHLAPDPLAYQAQICKFSQKLHLGLCMIRLSTTWQPQTSWPLFQGQRTALQWHLTGANPPYCISCHTYRHRTLTFKPALPSIYGLRTIFLATQLKPLQPVTSTPTASPSRHLPWVKPTLLFQRPNCQFQNIGNKPEGQRLPHLLTLLLNSRTILFLSLSQIFSMIYSEVATSVTVALAMQESHPI